jgi:hypothetical protein
VWGKDLEAIQAFIKEARADAAASVLDHVLELYKTRNLTVWNGQRRKKEFVLVEG